MSETITPLNWVSHESLGVVHYRFGQIFESIHKKSKKLSKRIKNLEIPEAKNFRQNDFFS